MSKNGFGSNKKSNSNYNATTNDSTSAGRNVPAYWNSVSRTENIKQRCNWNFM
jgi:hypothetical protein